MFYRTSGTGTQYLKSLLSSQVDSSQILPLHLAVLRGDSTIVEFIISKMIEYGLSKNEKECINNSTLLTNNLTPLHIAAW